jgi:hypothetical protein
VQAQGGGVECGGSFGIFEFQNFGLLNSTKVFYEVINCCLICSFIEVVCVKDGGWLSFEF